MAGNGWRLLTALSLIFMVPAPLPGQERVEARAPTFAPRSGRLRSSPFMVPAQDPFSAQFPPPPPVLAGTGFFEQIVSAAGIIFSGRVTSIGRGSSMPGRAAASTSVTFQVRHALRGSSPGQMLTIHEWAGLWMSGERYHVGESVLLFLYPPGKLGLTSPVAGAMGKFTVDSQDRILMNGQHTANFLTDPILTGKTVLSYSDFANAVRRSTRKGVRNE